jgi:integrase
VGRAARRTTEIVDGKRRQLGQACPKLRRADGSANPRHGTWGFAISVQGKGGKRLQVRRSGFVTAAEAQRERDQVRDMARRGVVSSHRLTVGQYLEEWLAATEDVRPSTLRAHQQHVAKYLLPELGHHRLADLRVADVAEALAAVTSSDANRQRVRATLRIALNDAVREGLISVNPAALVKLGSGRRPRAQVWTEERVQRWTITGEAPSAVMVWTPAQLGQFLDHIAGDRLEAMFSLIAHCGLRRGEACGLRWEDFDPAAGAITICRQRTQVGWDVIEGPPKSAAGGRVVALDAGTVAMLRDHLSRQLDDQQHWGSAWDDSGRIFTGEDGSQLHPAAVTARFVQLAADAGLPPVRLHDLRHGAASIMLAAGVPMKVVSETLGHSMISITADTYSSVYSEVAAEAAEAAAAFIQRRPAGTGVHTSSTHTGPDDLAKARNSRSRSGAGGVRTHDLTDYEPPV